jgi:hypothetical protein
MGLQCDSRVILLKFFKRLLPIMEKDNILEMDNRCSCAAVAVSYVIISVKRTV